MKKIAGVVLGCCAGLLMANGSVAEEVFVETQNYALSDISRLVFDIAHSDTTLVAGDGKALALEYTQKLRYGDKERCLFTLTGETHGRELQITTEQPSKLRGDHCNVRRELSIVLDQQTLSALVVEFMHGKLRSSALRVDDQKIRGLHAGMQIEALVGNNIELRAQHSNVDIDEIKAEQLVLTGRHGDLDVRAVTAGDLAGDWAHGDVSLETAETKTLAFDVAHGAIQIDRHSGDSLKLTSAHGKIKARKSEATEVELVSRHGDIIYAGDSRTMDVRVSHGDAVLAQRNAAFNAITWQAKHGDLKLSVPEASVCRYLISSSSNVSPAVLKDKQACLLDGDSGELELGGSHTRVHVKTL